MSTTKKRFRYFFGIIFSLCLVVTLLITSVEAVAYWTPGYYEKEYTKYNVTETVHMEMNDLLDVTEEMMAYLRGDREDLHVPAIVDGQPREFFSPGLWHQYCPAFWGLPDLALGTPENKTLIPPLSPVFP